MLFEDASHAAERSVAIPNASEQFGPCSTQSNDAAGENHFVLFVELSSATDSGQTLTLVEFRLLKMRFVWSAFVLPRVSVRVSGTSRSLFGTADSL